MVEELVKHIAIGGGVGIGGNFIADRYATFITPTWFYIAGALLAVLGIVGGKDHYEYVPIGLSLVGGTWAYRMYLQGYLGKI